MANLTFKGQPINISGTPPKVGEIAPPFCLVSQDLKEVELDAFKGQKKILNLFPSMDTPVCSQSIQTFYTRCQSIPHLVLLNISMDLPFAAARFCQTQHLKNAVTLSAFRSSFLDDYKVKMTNGPLKGLSARAVFILNEDHSICYAELVPEITQEPNYSAAFDAL